MLLTLHTIARAANEVFKQTILRADSSAAVCAQLACRRRNSCDAALRAPHANLRTCSVAPPARTHAFRFAGTSLRFRPGVVTGGAGLAHDCGRERAIGYFVEPLLLMALFAKQVRGGGTET